MEKHYRQKPGAQVEKDGVVFSVWAPARKSIQVVAKTRKFSLAKDAHGYFAGKSADFQPGELYKFRLDDEAEYADPYSCFQPEGPHGPSMIVDHSRFPWHDDAWQKQGVTIDGQVLYELHVGTFSPQGNYAGVAQQLPALKAMGITALELMPLAEVPGRWNWGYDGVNLFAPTRNYGAPDELKQLVEAAHALGLAVILDVVYNHLGPDGNYLTKFSADYFTSQRKTEWGDAWNFDGENSRPVRDYILDNACYWLTHFHFDGLRLDATQAMLDDSPQHILAELSARARHVAGPKKILLIGENEPQNTRMILPLEKGGYGLDALWNDDFHHTARVALSARREAYYMDHLGRPQEFIALWKHGFLYQGQYYKWQKKKRGSVLPAETPAKSLIVFLENHDQVANTLTGDRLCAENDPALYRAITALCLLAPQTPMLFMGQEYGSTKPFLYFADHNADLAKLVHVGRVEFLAQFPSIKSAQARLLSPHDEQTFQRSKLDFSERHETSPLYRLHRDLLRLRREDAIFRRQDRQAIDGAILAEQAFVLRCQGPNEDRLVIANLGTDLDYSPCPEPLLVPLPQKDWRLLWSSEDPLYGGKGTVPAFGESGEMRIAGHSVQVFA